MSAFCLSSAWCSLKCLRHLPRKSCPPGFLPVLLYTWWRPWCLLGILGRMWNAIASVHDHCCFMYVGKSRKVPHLYFRTWGFQRKSKSWKTSLLLCEMIQIPAKTKSKKSSGRKTSFVSNYSPTALTITSCLKTQNKVSSSKHQKRNINRKRPITHHNETFPFSPHRYYSVFLQTVTAVSLATVTCRI